MKKSRYRNPESYTSKDPEKRARQLSNLKRGRTKGSVKALKTPENDPYDPKYRHDIIHTLKHFISFLRRKCRSYWRTGKRI